MREIKFRAWHKIQKQMFIVHAINWQTGGIELYIDTEFEKGSYPYERIRSVELLQYTGLKDKGSKKIYEGDIVRAYESTGDEYNTVHQIRYFADSSDYPAFDIFPTIDTDCNGISYLVTGEGEIEVIGNIYENPELLEQAK